MTTIALTKTKRTFTPDELRDILDKHRKWLNGEEGGVRADLRGSNLRGSDLSGSDLSGKTALPGGFSWDEYLDEVVPAFLQAGGKGLDETANPETWGCHQWSNCPTHAAFGANEITGVPALYRPIATEFIQFFDNGLIPLGRVNPKYADPR